MNVHHEAKAGAPTYALVTPTYALVTPEFDGAFVSNEYPTFDCDPDSIRPEFLVAYTLPQKVWSDLARGSKGLGHRRQRLQPRELLAHELWLPPIAWQHKLAEIYNRVEASRKDRERVKEEIDALLPYGPDIWLRALSTGL